MKKYPENNIKKINSQENTPESYSQKFKSMVEHVIKPEERRLKNYINPYFWQTKYDEYKKLREKEKEDLNVYETLSYGARPSIEYYLLTVLSCLIATAGLIQGSPAVIIGAMIVAPLMTPILAFSLGVIWGDAHLIETSIGSIIKGTLLAILISTSLSFFVPISEYNSEILARTKPNLFDIVVAISSGLVGAYGNANKKISNTLVGIAIAVALMPPLCTIGIGLGNFDWSVARGAIILYSINLISISLAGAIVFWVMKIHPKSEEKEKVNKRALSQIIISTILLTAIAIPVGIYTYSTFKLEHAKKTVWAIAKENFSDDLFSVQFIEEQTRFDVIITVLSNNTQEDKFKNVATLIKKQHPDFSAVKIKFIPTTYKD